MNEISQILHRGKLIESAKFWPSIANDECDGIN